MNLANLSPTKQEFLRRQETRRSFLAWCQECGYIPALHHRLVISELEKLVKGENNRLIILMPPGAAKSTYTSKLFPPWFLAQKSGLTILACSHSGELATSFGRVARNYAEGNVRWLGFTLNKESRAADEWETSNGGRFYCAGVGAGLSGHRADLGLIDDFCGKEEEVNSKLFNDKTWDWYVNDFVPRLKPGASRVIIANHRNEDDLVGRLLQREADKWRVIRLRLRIDTLEQEEQDPLGRKVGDWLWPEYFTKELVDERMRNPRASGIEQQEPTPESGNFFESAGILLYDRLPLKDECHFYAASDHAVSEAQTADLTALIVAALHNDKLYIMPDIAWDRFDSKTTVEKMLHLAGKYKPFFWWAEKGHISKSIGPFLYDRMTETKTYVTVVQVQPAKDKKTRAQTIQGMMSMKMVYFPNPEFFPEARWFYRAKKELLSFPNAAHDDFVDAIAHLGRGIRQMTTASKPAEAKPFVPPIGLNITMRDIRERTQREKRARAFADM